jgi:hypothetical protein
MPDEYPSTDLCPFSFIKMFPVNITFLIIANAVFNHLVRGLAGQLGTVAVRKGTVQKRALSLVTFFFHRNLLF